MEVNEEISTEENQETCPSITDEISEKTIYVVDQGEWQLKTTDEKKTTNPTWKDKGTRNIKNQILIYNF